MSDRLPLRAGEVHYSPKHGYVVIGAHSGINVHVVTCLNNGRCEIIHRNNIEWKNQHTGLPDWVHAELMKRLLTEGD